MFCLFSVLWEVMEVMDLVLVFIKGQIKEVSICIVSYFLLYGCCTGNGWWLQLPVNYLLNRNTESGSLPYLLSSADLHCLSVFGMERRLEMERS